MDSLKFWFMGVVENVVKIFPRRVTKKHLLSDSINVFSLHCPLCKEHIFYTNSCRACGQKLRGL